MRRMALTVGLALLGVVIAFGAGQRWQHSRRAIADHKLARTGVRTMRRNKWLSFRAAVVIALLLVAYLVGMFNLVLNGDGAGESEPSPKPSTGRR
jgi:ABC-type Fe3+ transport system permease subunit